MGEKDKSLESRSLSSLQMKVKFLNEYGKDGLTQESRENGCFREVKYQGADKSLARQGRKQAAATKL
jgi:hypothetical protein